MFNPRNQNMFIKRIVAHNYRTLENVDVSFTSAYTAISGKNNAGKSNIIKAIRMILSPTWSWKFRFSSFPERGSDWKDQITSWKKDSKEDVAISIELEIHKDGDSSIFKFFTEFIIKDSSDFTIPEVETLKIDLLLSSKNKMSYSIFLGSREVSDDFQKTEILRRLRNTQCLIFHNSTNLDFNPFERDMDQLSNFISSSDLDSINRKKEELVKIVQRSLKNHQAELTKLLGNLEDKYEVSLSTPGLNFERESIDISLKEKGAEVSLDDWGSGTRNRTMIFLSILNAKRAQHSLSDSERISPIIVIEEPECFLHPQAQAEFGRILQNLATELKIQIITTTHSPYLLSFKSPDSNVLISRDTRPKSRDRSSHVINTSLAEKWYEPFAVALGINSSDFGPMKDLIFSEHSNILLVEGELDKSYFEYLQSPAHGGNALTSNIEIFPYEGADNVKNTILMNFIRKKFTKVVLTVDLDRFTEVRGAAVHIGFKENWDFFPIGKNELAKKSIEGLVPPEVYKSLGAKEPDLLQRLSMSIGQELKSEKKAFKKKLLEEFKTFPINDLTHSDFYALVKKINKAFKQ